jgi:hypothetical protein
MSEIEKTRQRAAVIETGILKLADFGFISAEQMVEFRRAARAQANNTVMALDEVDAEAEAQEGLTL